HTWYIWCSLFFFSSRRRHTRFSRDWSSDVCSSDLVSCWRFRLVSQLLISLASVVPAFGQHRAGSLLVLRCGSLLLVRVAPLATRSEERRVGKECRCGWRPEH